MYVRDLYKRLFIFLKQKKKRMHIRTAFAETTIYRFLRTFYQKTVVLISLPGYRLVTNLTRRLVNSPSDRIIGGQLLDFDRCKSIFDNLRRTESESLIISVSTYRTVR